MMKKKAEKRPVKATLPPEEQARQGFPIVGIGASAGGLEAFEAFFKKMPPDSSMAFVLVAHLDPTHVSLLPELLQKHTKMAVHQIQDGTRVQANSVYIIPPNKNLSILNDTLQLLETMHPRGANMAIDSFFRSLAQDCGTRAVGIILSGTGTDGTLGLKAIKGESGMVMVQDKESAKYDGMPRSAIATNLADYVLPPGKMPAQLIKYTKHLLHKDSPTITLVEGKVPDALQKIFIILRTRTSHDFSHYKKNTICRRIERRMSVHQIDNTSEYVRYLQESKSEATILFKELLIGVTNFFRDKEAFDALKENLLSNVLKTKPNDSTVRVWVPACSSGEEAYSVAIILHECMEVLNRHFNVQIFGTDIDTDAVDTARAGIYPASIISDVLPSERLSRYFTKEEDGRYRINSPIREMLVFAPQNVIKDPPFTKLDLLCCRNLLIYLGPELQKKLLPLFHYSLLPEGILFLGSSETLGQAKDLFAVLDQKWKMFRPKLSAFAARTVLDFPTKAVAHEVPEPEVPAIIKKAEKVNTIGLMEALLRQSDTPPCAIIDDEGNVIYIHGRTGRFLEPAEGKISVNVLEMARPGLKEHLATALRKVRLHKQEVVHKGLRAEYDGGHLFLDLRVKPFLEPNVLRGMMMVVFQETSSPRKMITREPALVAVGERKKNIEEIEQELRHTRENLQTTIEEMETSNEELKSTNEELQSTNEELQSTNEEMQTSKEELQSLNEEASTVNAELQSKITELSKANDDMKNLLDSTEIATVFLDMDLCIQRFTSWTTNIIPLVATDFGRPIKHFASNLMGTDLAEYAEGVLKDLAMREMEVRSKDGSWFIMRLRPYRTVNNVIDGVVITFNDVTELKRKAQEVQEAREYAEGIVATLREPLVVLDADLRVVSASRSFLQKFKVKEEETKGKLLYDLGNKQWDIPALRELLEEILPKNTTIEGFEVEHDFEDIGQRTMLLNARRIYSETEKTELMLLAIEDITERKRTEEEREQRLMVKNEEIIRETNKKPKAT